MIKIATKHLLSLEDLSDSAKSSPSQWKGRKIGLTVYSSFMGAILHLFGMAIKIKTKDDKVLYAKKSKLLKQLSSSEQESKKIIASLQQSAIFPTIAQSDLVSHIQSNYQSIQTDFDQIDQKFQALNGFNEDLFSLSNLLSKIKILSSIDPANAAAFSQDLMNLEELLIEERKKNLRKDKEKIHLTNLIDKIQDLKKLPLPLTTESVESIRRLQLFVPQVEEMFVFSQNQWFLQINFINQTLQNTLNSSQAIQFFKLPAISIFLKLEALVGQNISGFPINRSDMQSQLYTMGFLVSSIYQSKELITCFEHTQAEYELKTKDLIKTKDENQIIEHFKRENDFINLAFHAKENLESLIESLRKKNPERSFKYIERSRAYDQLIISSSDKRFFSLLGKLNKEKIKELISTEEFNPETGTYRRAGNILKKFLKK